MKLVPVQVVPPGVLPRRRPVGPPPSPRYVYPSIPPSRPAGMGPTMPISPGRLPQAPLQRPLPPGAGVRRPPPPAARPLTDSPMLRQAIREELETLQRQAPPPPRAVPGMPSNHTDPGYADPGYADPGYATPDANQGAFFDDPWGEFGEEAPVSDSTAQQVVVAQTPAQSNIPAAPLQPITPAVALQPGPQTAIVVSDGYGPLAQMSPHLRIQAASGYRAGVIRLKNGMFLVAEIHQSALEPEFGMTEVLAPLVVKSAVKALENPNTQDALLDAAARGAHAMGRGLEYVSRQPSSKPRPSTRVTPPPPPRPASAAPVVQPHQLPPAGYLSWPPPYYPMPMLPPGFPMAYPGVPLAYPPGQAPLRTLPPAPAPLPRPSAAAARARSAQPGALPWADEEDFAGLDDSDWEYQA